MRQDARVSGRFSVNCRIWSSIGWLSSIGPVVQPSTGLPSRMRIRSRSTKPCTGTHCGSREPRLRSQYCGLQKKRATQPDSLAANPRSAAVDSSAAWLAAALMAAGSAAISSPPGTIAFSDAHETRPSAQASARGAAISLDIGGNLARWKRGPDLPATSEESATDAEASIMVNCRSPMSPTGLWQDCMLLEEHRVVRPAGEPQVQLSDHCVDTP